MCCDSLKNMKFHPITVIGGSRGVIEDKTPFLGKGNGVFCFK
jgi:hypothetical protein